MLGRPALPLDNSVICPISVDQLIFFVGCVKKKKKYVLSNNLNICIFRYVLPKGKIL